MPMLADTATKIAAGLVVATIIVLGLVAGREMLVPLALSIILAFILSPIVRLISRHGVPRPAAVGVVVSLAVALVIVASASFSTQILSLTADLGSYRDNLVQKVRAVTGDRAGDGLVQRALRSIENLETAMRQEMGSREVGPSADTKVVVEPGSGSTTMLEGAGKLLAPLAMMGLTLLFTLFLLLQHNDMRDRVVRLMGTDNMTETTAALSEAGYRLSRLFLLQALLNGGFGVVVAVGLFIIGVPSPVLWGVATAFLRFVPFIGSFLSAIPPVLLAAAVDPGWGMAVATLMLFAIGEPLMGHVVEPLVLGRGIGLSPLALVLSASFWTLVWGPVGLLLAAPLTMSLVVLGQYVPRLQFLDVLLGDNPALSPDYELYHRLLSQDAGAAADQLDTSLADTAPPLVADAVVLPALRLAARDFRLGRLDRDEAASIGDTLFSALELVGATKKGEAADLRQDRAHCMIVPAQGPIDVLSARAIAAMLRRVSDARITPVTTGSGMMALSDAAASSAEGGIDTLVISTVGGIDPRLLRHLSRRARQQFPDARILVGNWGAGEEERELERRAQGELAAEVTSLSRLADAVPLVGAGPRTEPSTLREPTLLPAPAAMG